MRKFKSVSIIAIFALLAQILCFPRNTFASTVSDLTDQPSTLLVSTASNHRFALTFTSIVSEGETLTFEFPNDFDTSTISEDDVDVIYGGSEVATDGGCVGADASIVMAADVLTLTRCAGSGAFSIGQTLVVLIGTNASNSGLGTHQIINPSTPGTYYVNIAGDSGNEGSIPLPIGTRSGAGVSVSFTGGTGAPTSGGDDDGGGGTPDPNPDPDPEPTPDPTPDPEPEPDPDPEPTPDPTPDPEPEPTPEPNPNPDPTPESTPDSEATPEQGDEDTDREQTVLNVDLFATPDLVLEEHDGTVDVLAGTQTTIVVSVSSGPTPEAMLLVLGDTQYVLSPNENGSFSGTIPTPSSDDVLSAVAVFSDGSQTSENVAVTIRGAGSVYEMRDGVRQLLSGSVLTVYETGTGREVAWDAGAFGQNNPLVTSTGYFSWYAPNGVYIIYANKTGYEESSVTVRVTNQILAVNIQLERIPENVVPPVAPETPSRPTITPTESLQEILASPVAKTVSDISLPVTAALAGGTVAALSLGFNLFAYLQYFFTSPLLLFGRKKRKTYGIVYNSMAKTPIELATVRVYKMPERRLVKTVVTSPEGKYSLTIDPGEYTLQAIKSGFVFPSEYLEGQKIDGQYLDIYTGQILRVADDEALIAANIPLDPSQAEAFHAPRALAFKRLVRVVQLIVAPIGLVLSIVACVITPNWLTILMLSIQVVMLLLVIRLAKPRRPKGWGIVYDDETEQPVGNTVIRVFEPKYNKLVETALTDSRGRYSFLLGQNEYFVTYNKPGYAEKIVRPIDYTNKPEPTPLAMNVGLQHVAEEQHVSDA